MQEVLEPEEVRTSFFGIGDSVQASGINLFKNVLLPLAKAGTEVTPGPLLAQLLSKFVVEMPLTFFRKKGYVINPCDRGIIYDEDDPDFDFYDWVFPEQQWCAMLQAFLDLCRSFERQRDFVLTLPTLVYFLKQDEASVLSRSRKADMMAIDPTYPDPQDKTWKEFRIEFATIARKHEGSPHINKTQDGAINHFADAHDETLVKEYIKKQKEMDHKGLFLNDFFKTMFAKFL